ncbi:hypothetical protein VNO77_16378 [Canavalia gladiata]|uniref:Uncharacterized protein n=1 Tax=Canavalia gladiata TaxID=3824 RepID=A0AAN9QS12_CANGL
MGSNSFHFVRCSMIKSCGVLVPLDSRSLNVHFLPFWISRLSLFFLYHNYWPCIDEVLALRFWLCDLVGWNDFFLFHEKTSGEL